MTNALVANPLHDQPSRLGSLMHVVATLLDYGRHLALTVVARARNPNFASIAVCFGTAHLPLIMARIERGILRATILARVLNERAALGRDVQGVSPHRPPREPRPAAPKHAPRTPRPDPSRWDDLVYPPTLEEIEARVRRRPIGRTIVDICLDLAVMPGLCERVFGSELFDAIHFHRGRISRWMTEKQKRWKAFGYERDVKRVNGWWDWWDDTRERTRGVLGFHIGEPPTLPAELLPAPP
jgi:hypothetical protein